MATSSVEPPSMSMSTISENDPNFAIICSFFFKFGPSLGVSFSIQELKEMIEDSTRVNEELIDLHIKLLRKRRKYINKDKWERALVKFCLEYSNVDAWEVERYGYKNCKVSIKLEVLKRLLEAQFDYNSKFKLEVNANEAEMLRITPIGRDVLGHMYWYQMDANLNLRIYREEVDDDTSWKLVCNNRDQLEKLLNELQAKSSIDSNEIKEESLSLSDTNDDSNLTKLSVMIKEESKEEMENGQGSAHEMNDIKTEVEEEIETKSDLDVKIEQPYVGDISDGVGGEVKEEKPEIESTEQDDAVQINIDEISTQPEEISIKNETVHPEPFIKDEPIEISESDVVSNDPPVPMPSELDLNVEHESEEIAELVNELVDKVSSEASTTKSSVQFSEISLLSIEQTVSIVCDYLVDEICRLEESSSNTTTDPLIEIVSAINNTGRGRGRGRGRGGNRRGRGRGMSRELRNLMMDNVPMKRSKRIQELQQKKIAQMAEQMKQEQVKLEQLAKRKAEQREKEELMNGTSKKRKRIIKSESEEEESSSSEEDSKKKKRRRKRKFGANPWDVEESSSESSVEESEPEHEDDDEELKFDDNEDEFACEEMDPNAEPVIVRRARTVKKLKSDIESSSESSSDSEVENDDKPCGKCGKYDHPEWILLCDKCDDGYHTACLRPPLMLVPDGDWFCPPCEHKMLCEKLKEELDSLSSLLVKKEREELRKQRLKYVAISVDNILKQPKERKKSTESLAEKEVERNGIEEKESSNEEEEDDEEESEDDDEEEDEFDYGIRKSRSHRNRKTINYQFTEFDELINSAIQEDIEEERGAGMGKGKDMANITSMLEEAEKRENQIENKVEPVEQVDPAAEEGQEQVDEPKEDLDDEDFEIKPTRQTKAQRKRHRGLNDLESPTEEEDSDEDFKGSSDTELEEMSDEEFVENDSQDTEEQSDDSIWKMSRRRSRKPASRGKVKGKRNRGKRGYRRDDFVVTSDDSDNGAGFSRTKTRAAARKKISYREETSEEETEEEEYSWRSNRSKRQKSESESSDSEWGAKKSGKKQKRSWGRISDDEEEDDDEENEDEEEDEDEDDEAETKNVESKKETKKHEPSTKTKVTAKKLEMKGKPRLSKARMISLREDSGDDSNDKRKKLSEEREDDDDDEEEDGDEEDESSDSEDKTKVPEVGKESQIEPSNKTNEDGAVSPNKQPPYASVDEALKMKIVDQEKPVDHVAASTGVNCAGVQVLTSSNSPATSSLIPSRPVVIVSETNSTSSPAQNKPPSSLNYDNYPPEQLSKPMPNDSNQNMYNLGPIDPYTGRPVPLRPTSMPEVYPRPASPPRLLTLESNAYPRHAAYPQKPVFDPKMTRGPAFIDPRMSLSFGNSPNLRPDMNSRPPTQPHGPVNYPPHPRVAPPPYYGQPPYLRSSSFRQEQFLPSQPPHPSAVRNLRSSPPVTTSSPPYRVGPPPSGASPYQALAGPGNYFPHQAPPNYYPGQPAPHENMHLAQNYPPSYPPHLQYPSYYPGAGPSPNGGFMIQNLLQHRAASEDNPTGPQPMDEMRNMTEFSPFLTQE